MLATRAAGVIHLGEDAPALGYRHRFSSAWRSSAPQRRAARKLKPCTVNSFCPALQEGVELVLHKLWQISSSLLEEACGMLLHQTVQRGLLGAVAFAWTGAPFGVLCRAQGSRANDLGRSQARQRAAIAPSATCLWMPASVWSPSGDRALSLRHRRNGTPGICLSPPSPDGLRPPSTSDSSEALYPTRPSALRVPEFGSADAPSKQ